MKTRSISDQFAGFARRRMLAYTLTEMLVSASLFLLLVGGVVYGYMFGLSMYQVTRVKLGASDDARKSFIRLTDEIRSAWQVQVGNGSQSSFTQVASNALQRGNALQIYMQTSDTNTWIRYWYQTNSSPTNTTTLLRIQSWQFTNDILTVCHSITNIVPLFTSEDASGNILSNNVNNRVIGVTLQFYQLEYPRINVGPGSYYDFYQLHTRITRRTLF
ncbi:MAG TPA: hypothetical protein VN281_20235 [Verrucomicrobiae bacterium]|nr:hypothetical protein [Verrucomicrobiae bacterium]